MIFVFTGPESTAKTTLAATLAERFGAGYVEEQARIYLQAKELERRGAYLPSDLFEIAKLQLAAEQERAEYKILIADTDLQVIRIWWREKYGPVPAALQYDDAARTPRYYLLCQPDIAWQEDPQRENPLDRDRLFELYLRDLEDRGLPFEIIAGEGRARVDCAISAVANRLQGT